MTIQCRGIIEGKPCDRPARAKTELCRACYMRRWRGGFVMKVCKPWEKQALLRATRRAAREAFKR